MADSESIVNILLKVQGDSAALNAMQAELQGLKTSTAESQAAMAAWRAETGLSSQATIGATNLVGGLGQAVGRTAADFAPATAAQRAASVAMAETAINASALERGVIQMTAGITRAIPGTSALGGEVRALGLGSVATAGQVGLLNTVLIGAGIAGALAFAAALAAIVTKGVEVQKTLQDLGQGVQGTLSTDSNFGAAASKAAGPAAIQQITQSAKDAQVPISELAKAFDQVFPAAARANTSIKGLSDLIAQLISQEDALHIPQGKLITDLEQIFNGSVRNTNQLAQELGVTKEQAAAARESGTTTDLLVQKQQEFAAAHESAGETISRAEQQVQAAFEQLAAAAAKPIIEPVTKALIDMANAMNDPAIQAGASYIISQFEAIIAEILQVIHWCQEVGHAIVNALNAAASFTANAVTSLMNPADSNAVEVDRLNQQEGLAAKSRQDAANASNAQELEAITVEAKTGTRAPVGAGGGKGGGGKKGPSVDSEDQKEISDIMSQINEKQTAYNALVEKAKVDHDLGLTSLKTEQDQIVSSSSAYSKSIDDGIAKLTAEKQKIEDLGTSQGGLNTKEDEQVNKLQAAIDKLTLMQSKLQLINAQNTFGGQFTIGLQKFADTLQLTGTKAASFFTSTLTTGIDSASTALTGLIFQTGNWRQTFEQAAESIIQNLIKIGLQSLIGLTLEQTTSAASRLDSARTAAAGAYASAAPIPYIGFIIAPIAAALAFAAVAAFASGGIVEGSPSSSDNRIARVATGEGIVTSRAVQHYGAQHIHNLNSLSFAGGGVIGGSSSFGSAGGGGSSSKGVSINNFWDPDEMSQHIINHPDLTHHIVNTMRKNRFVLKV